jgi:hypothetical protein
MLVVFHAYCEYRLSCVPAPYKPAQSDCHVCFAGMFVVERVGRRMLLAVGGAFVAATMAVLAILLALYMPDSAGTDGTAGGALLPAVLVLLCINRIALTCTLQPLAATGEQGIPSCVSLCLLGAGRMFCTHLLHTAAPQ